jgi:hypothetical protein
MGNELPLLSAWPLQVWSLPMAMGFVFSHDIMVKAKCHEFYTRFEDNAAKTKQKELVNSRNDFLGKINPKGQNFKSTFKL